MAALSELIADYEENADYAEVGSAEKAAAFITVCRKLLIRLPARASQGSGAGGANESEYNTALISEQMKIAQRWIDARSNDDGPPSVIYPDFSDFRQ